MFNALVIDDNFDNRTTFIKVLNRLGCKVNEAETAENGISKLALMSYHIVFAALCIKNIGARGIARWVKNNCPDTKVLIITSWKGQLEQHILEIEGIHGVIHKPLLFAEIRDVLLDQLG